MIEPAFTVDDLSPGECAQDDAARRKIDASIPRGPMTTERIGKLHTATRPLLVALHKVVEPQAARRGDTPVPAEILDAARALLSRVRRVLGNDLGQRRLYFIHPPLSWAGLLVKLQLALAGFREFHRTYGIDDDPDLVDMWRTPQYVEYCFMRAVLESQNNDFDEDD
jgi:hypothetical protein